MNKKQKRTIIVLSSVLLFVVCILLLVLSRGSKYVIDFNSKSITRTIEYGDTFLEPNITAVGHRRLFYRKKEKLKVTKEGSVDTGTIGKNKIKYTATYKGVTSSITITVNVTDTTPPEINLVSNPDSFTSPVGEYVEEGYSAFDNHDGDVTANVVRTPGDGIVTYSVEDSFGNKESVVRKIVYKDVVPPTVTLTGDVTVPVEVGTEYNEQGATATDDVDGDITDTVKVDGTYDINTPGVYTLTYTATDKSGNVGSTQRIVLVHKKQVAAVNPGDHVVYLTFDDGPYKYTEQLLDLLDKYNVKVTFFVTNQYPDYQNLIAEEAKRGHTVAIHSYSHNYASIYTSVDAYMADLNQMSDIVVAQTGKRPTIVRFPGGSSNTVSAKYCSGIMTALANTLTANGYYYCDWNVSSGDAGGTIATEQVVANVTSGIAGHDVSIVLQHDIKDFSVNAVEQILQWGLTNGYTFLPMSESTPMEHQHINN